MKTFAINYKNAIKMFISCLKYNSSENLFTGHLYVNFIYPSKATLEQRHTPNTQNSRLLIIVKSVFLQNKN